MALHFFKSHQMTVAQSAKIADLSIDAFIELLGEEGVAPVDYPPEELKDEMAVAL
jgi:predicted HTH domain antitoxin